MASLLLRRSTMFKHDQVITYTPILPSDTDTYPLTRNSKSEFAVTNNTGLFGYYNPLSDTFTEESGMSGDTIVRLDYVMRDSSGSYVETNAIVNNNSALEMRLYPTATGQNVAGYFSSYSGNDNLCFYESDNSSYSRYNGQVHRSLGVTLNAWNIVKIDKTGQYKNGTLVGTAYDAATFTSPSGIFIFNLPNSTSTKFNGRMDYVTIKEGNVMKNNFIAVKVGSNYRMFDCQNWEFPTHIGTFKGGVATGEAIPYPNPFIDGNKLYFYKEGIGFNPIYYSSKIGFTEAADHAYIQAGSGVWSNNNIVLNLPSSLSLTNVYLDGQANNTGAAATIAIFNNNPTATLQGLLNYTGATWNNSTTNRATNPGNLGIPQRLLNGQARTFTLRSNNIQFRCYNWYATYTSL